MIKIIILVLLPFSVFANNDPRYCIPEPGHENNSWARSTTIYNHFRKLHPCPSTGLYSGPCPGWQVNHIIPLASCGCVFRARVAQCKCESGKRVSVISARQGR